MQRVPDFLEHCVHITHTYRQDPLGLRNGPVMWPQRCGSPHVSPPYKARQEVEGTRPRGRPKKTWREIVEKDCRARGLKMEDAMCRSRWKKQIGMIDDHDECSE